MAVHVSTFSALCTALAAGNNEDIYIDADMDATDTPITAKIVVQSCNVYGQGHTIYNITDVESSSTPVFEVKANNQCVWQDTNFNNIYITNNGPLLSANYDQTSTSLTVRNCNFQGRFKSLFKRGTYEKCTIHGEGSLAIYADNVPAARVIFQELYVDLNCKVMGGSTRYAGYITNAIDCFFTGNVDVSGLSGDSGILAATTFTPTNCIFNMNITSNTPKTLKWTNSSTFAPSEICLYNESKLSNVTLSQTHAKMVAMSDSDMKNATAIAETGFPIVV